MSADDTQGDATPSPEDESDWDFSEPLSGETRGKLRDAVHELYTRPLTPSLLGRHQPLPVPDLGPNRPPVEFEPDRTQFKLLQQATEHLADIADQAQADAEQSRASTRHALWAAWAAVSVTVVVGIVQIVMAVNE